MPWIEDYAARFGDKLPDSDVIDISVGNKFQIYEKFKFHVDGLPDFDKDMVKPAYFYKLWNKYLPHIRVPRQNKFTKCTTCCDFKIKLQLQAPYVRRAEWMAAFDEHLTQQMQERMQYYRNRNHARMHPDEAWCLMADGMAQHCTNLPYYPRNKPKSVFGKTTYDLHVMGVMCHGLGPPRVYIHDSSVETGPNMTIQCIWNTICGNSSKVLPPLLYLQLDNTASDNKNHHVMEFCAWLVEQGIFEEVIFVSKIFSHLFNNLLVGKTGIHDGGPYARRC